MKQQEPYDCYHHSADRTYHWCVERQKPCMYPNCPDFISRAEKAKERHSLMCCVCGKELKERDDLFGNICRPGVETYCKEHYEQLSQKEKDLISWHFSCDWL